MILSLLLLFCVERKLLFSSISTLGSDVNPRNIPHIPVVNPPEADLLP